MSTPDPAEAAMIRSLEQKTGKSAEHWISTALASGPGEARGEIVKQLEDEHGLGARLRRPGTG
jgi:hypothetical protein